MRGKRLARRTADIERAGYAKERAGVRPAVSATK